MPERDYRDVHPVVESMIEDAQGAVLDAQAKEDEHKRAHALLSDATKRYNEAKEQRDALLRRAQVSLVHNLAHDDSDRVKGVAVGDYVEQMMVAHGHAKPAATSAGELIVDYCMSPSAGQKPSPVLFRSSDRLGHRSQAVVVFDRHNLVEVHGMSSKNGQLHLGFGLDRQDLLFSQYGYDDFRAGLPVQDSSFEPNTERLVVTDDPERAISGQINARDAIILGAEAVAAALEAQANHVPTHTSYDHSSYDTLQHILSRLTGKKFMYRHQPFSSESARTEYVAEVRQCVARLVGNPGNSVTLPIQTHYMIRHKSGVDKTEFAEIVREGLEQSDFDNIMHTSNASKMYTDTLAADRGTYDWRWHIDDAVQFSAEEIAVRIVSHNIVASLNSRAGLVHALSRDKGLKRLVAESLLNHRMPESRIGRFTTFFTKRGRELSALREIVNQN